MDINDLGMQLPALADIIFQRGKQRVKRTIPENLVSAFKVLVRDVSCFQMLPGKVLVNFADEYIAASRQHEWKFFLPDEKKLIEKFCQDATNVVTWEVKDER